MKSGFSLIINIGIQMNETDRRKSRTKKLLQRYTGSKIRITFGGMK